MSVVSKLTVEVLGPDQAFYPGIVNDINQETGSILVKFENDWQPEGWIPINGGNLFEAPPRRTVGEIRERLTIPGPVQVLYRTKQGSPEGWYPGHVVQESKELYTIDLDLKPSRRVHLPIEQLRLPRPSLPLTVDSIHRVEIPVPEKAIQEATDENHLNLFAKFGNFDFVFFDSAAKNIVVLVYGNAGVRRAAILADMHLNHALFRQSLRDEISNMRVELFGPNKKQLKENGNFFHLEFFVSLQNLLRCLGPQQMNLVKARSLPGIVQIWLDSKTGRFDVTAEGEEFAKQAQELLEFVTDVVYVDQPYVGQIIGKGGANVNEIWRNSNVLSLTLYDSADLLRSAGVPYEWREGFVPLVVTGFRADTDTAKMLIEYQVDHNRQMDAERQRRPPLEQGQDSLVGQGGEGRGRQRRSAFEQRRQDSLIGQGAEGVEGVEGRGGQGGEGHAGTAQGGEAREGAGAQGGEGRARTAQGGEGRGYQQGYRGGYQGQRRDGGRGQFDGQRLGGPREDKRNGQAEGGAVASKDWPELGAGSSGGEGKDGRKSEIQQAPPTAAVVQNGEMNGHSDIRNHQSGGGNTGGSGGGNGRGGGGNRNRGGKSGSSGGNGGSGGNGSGGSGGSYEQVDGQVNGGGDKGEKNGGGGEDVDGEGFRAVQPRGKRGRQSRGGGGGGGGGGGVANGIHPATEEPAENRREDQVSR